MDALDERYKMWSRILEVNMKRVLGSDERAERPQSARRASDDLDKAIKGALRDRKMFDRGLDSSGSVGVAPQPARPSDSGQVAPPSMPQAMERSAALESRDNELDYVDEEWKELQVVDRTTNDWNGFHVRTPSRKKQLHRTQYRSYVHSVPWALMADGMWFDHAPGLSVPPGKIAPWLPPEEAEKQLQHRNHRKRRGRQGFLEQQHVLRPEAKTKSTESIRGSTKTDTIQTSESAALADVDTQSVTSLDSELLHHVSAPFQVVAGSTRLPETSVPLGQLRGFDFEHLYRSLGCHDKDLREREAFLYGHHNERDES